MLSKCCLVERRLLRGPGEEGGGGLTKGHAPLEKMTFSKPQKSIFPGGFFLRRIWTNVVGDVFACAREHMQ